MTALREALSALALILFAAVVITTAQLQADPRHEPVSPDFHLKDMNP